MPNTIKILNALTDETRLRILLLLASGSLCVCEIVYIMEMKQARISRIMKKFREAGLVEQQKSGRKVIYSLSADALRAGVVRGILDDMKISAADLTRLKKSKDEQIREGKGK